MTTTAPKYAVPKIKLGLTDTKIPIIGQGTYKYDAGPDLLRYGIDLGVTMIDTAEIYGTESVVGEAVEGRPDAFVITKLWKNHILSEEVLEAQLNSTVAIGRDIIDLYMLHFPMEHMALPHIMPAFEYMIYRKYVRYIGVCNLSLDQLKEAQDCLKDARIEAVQCRYNLNRREIEKDILPYCQQNNITFMAYEPLDQGRLGNRYKEALQFLVQQEGVVAIVRSGNKEHIKANIDAVCEVL